MGLVEIGVAAFACDRKGTRTLELESTLRVRGASVLKPLLAWTAAACGPFVTDRASWESLARPAITSSDNAATAALWSRGGNEALLDALNDRIGLAWLLDGDGEHPSLRVMVTAGELACAYAALAADKSDVGVDVRQWMCEVPAAQTFAVRHIAGNALSVEESSVGVKCGWFGGDRAHAVVLVELGDRTVGATVTTTHSPNAATVAAVRDAAGDDDQLAALHNALAGVAIRAMTRPALLAAAKL